MLIWKSAFGESELSVRLLSVVFGLGSVSIIYELGATLINRRVGLTAAFLAAIAPLHVYYSREARMYMMLAFLSALTAVFLWLAITRNQKRYWAAYLLAGGALIYTHIFGWFVLLAGSVYALLKREGKLVGKLALHQTVFLVLFIPWAPYILRQMGQAGMWLPQFWLETPPALAIPKTLMSFGAGASYPRYLTFSHVSPLRHISYFVFGALGLLAFLKYRDEAAADAPMVSDARRYLLVHLFVPLSLPYAISFIKPVYLVARYDFLAYPFFAVLIGLGIVKMGRYALLGIAAVGLLSSYSLSRYFTAPVPDFNRETIHYIAESGGDGDIVVTVGLRFAPIKYYMRRGGRNFRLLAFPPSIQTHPGWIDFRQSREELTHEANAIVDAALSAGAPGRPVWVVIAVQGELNDILTDRIQKRFRHVSFNQNCGVVCFVPK
jgi:4-amino-4-deoxy-L-arabinose transferase-like glycosyltransferase